METPSLKGKATLKPSGKPESESHPLQGSENFSLADAFLSLEGKRERENPERTISATGCWMMEVPHRLI